MSRPEADTPKPAEASSKETERIQAGPGPGRGPFGGGMVGQKANDFKPDAKRLVRRMGPRSQGDRRASCSPWPASA